MFDFVKKLFSDNKNQSDINEKSLVEEVSEAFSSKNEFDDLTCDDLEEMLIKADVGVDVATKIVDKIRYKEIFVKPEELKNYLKKEFAKVLDNIDNKALQASAGLNIYMVVGVNGAGKTTFLGKLAHKLKTERKKVLIAAGDTFRAAAEEQLDVWAKRADVDILRRDGIQSSAVVFEAIKKAQNENYDYLLIDTAGRLQNKYNLMEELSKLKAVIDKNAKDSFKESLLVLDATTGQNGISQAKIFNDIAELTGIILTKFDGSAKGGIIFAIADKFKIPVKMLGVGEKITDLIEFDKEKIINALFE